MYYDPYALKIYIDGSCLKNPGGSGGIAGIIEYPDETGKSSEKIFSEGYKSSTSNRMELRACIKGMYYLRTNKKNFKGLREILITDSVYILTEDDVNEMVEKSDNIEELTKIVIEKGISPEF